MTNEEQKDKYREWLYGLANEGCEAKFLANVKVLSYKRDDETTYFKAYMSDGYVIFTPTEWCSMYQMALSVLRARQLSWARPPKGRGILDQIERDNPDK